MAELPYSLEKNNYMLIKTDKQHKITYANYPVKDNRNGLMYSYELLNGQHWQRYLHADLPKSIVLWLDNVIAERSFFNAYLPMSTSRADACWLFADFGGRFSSEGQPLGYELLAYAAPVEAVELFSELYKQITSLELTQAPAAELAESVVGNECKRRGVSYDQLVALFQSK